PVNDAPIANDDVYVTDEDTLLRVLLLGVIENDVDVDGDPLHIVTVHDPTHGLLTMYPNGSFTYLPNPNWFGIDTFEYAISDGTIESNLATVTIEVFAVNDAPIADDDDYSTNEDFPVSVPAPGVLNGDTDVEIDPLTSILVIGPVHGTLILNSDGSFDYFPDPNFFGTDAFTYIASDGALESNIATVTITVNPVDDPAVAVDDYATTDEDTPINIDVMANDYDIEGDSFSLLGFASDPAEIHGELTLVDVGGTPMIQYTPDSNWHGSAWFIYSIGTTGSTQTDTAYVYITVNPVNDAPVAVDDYVVLDEDTSVIIDFMGNDYDVDDSYDWSQVSWVPSDINGELELVHNYEAEPGVFRTALRYTPNPDWYGSSSSITYIIQDSFGAQASARIYITVNPVNDAPVGVDDSYTIDEDTSLDLAAPGLLANDYDVDGDTITLVVVTVPSHGSGSIGADGAFSYTPNLNWYGTDSMTYRVFDGTEYSGIVTVSITVNPVNDAPVGVDDEYTIDEDGSLSVPAPGVLANDYDVDGDSLSAVLVDPPHGSGSFGSNGALNYNPPADWHGVTTLTYKVFDGTEYSGIVTVTIIVNSVNDAPVGVDDEYTIDEDTSLNLAAPGLLENDYDVDGDTITLVVVTVPSHGSGSIGADGSFSYTPNLNWYGTDSMTYQAFDGTEYSGIVTVTITVNPVNDAPVGVDDEYTIDEDGSLSVP
ncbi:MAG: Ig-like domain-containing protein, partial [Candidatus Thorarchaeota archaeon]